MPTEFIQSTRGWELPLVVFVTGLIWTLLGARQIWLLLQLRRYGVFTKVRSFYSKEHSSRKRTYFTLAYGFLSEDQNYYRRSQRIGYRQYKKLSENYITPSVIYLPNAPNVSRFLGFAAKEFELRRKLRNIIIDIGIITLVGAALMSAAGCLFAICLFDNATFTRLISST